MITIEGQVHIFSRIKIYIYLLYYQSFHLFMLQWNSFHYATCIYCRRICFKEAVVSRQKHKKNLCFMLSLYYRQEFLSTLMKKIEDKNMEVANMKDTLDSQVRKGEELQAFLSEKEDRICVLETQNSELVLEGEVKAEKVRAGVACISNIFHNDIFFALILIISIW